MQKDISNIILGIPGHADCFTLKYGLFRFRLKIKPITARQLIEISGELGEIKAVDQDMDMFPEMLQRAEDLKAIANSIAIATGTRFRKIVAKGILGLDLKDIFTLFKLVRKQTDPEVFFCIMISSKGLIRTVAKEQP